jgi:hypothetical protein
VDFIHKTADGQSLSAQDKGGADDEWWILFIALFSIEL